MEQHGVKSVGPCLTIYHDPDHRERDVEVEVCEPVDRRLAEHPRIRVHELPAVEIMTSVVDEGSYAGFVETYAVLLGWIETSS
jgi:effector-binding domain-containing protein